MLGLHESNMSNKSQNLVRDRYAKPQFAALNIIVWLVFKTIHTILFHNRVRQARVELARSYTDLRDFQGYERKPWTMS